MSNQKRIIIEALAIGLPMCGLHEYARQLCPRILSKCPQEFRITFLVPPGKKGCFGPDAEYIETDSLRVVLLRHFPLIKGDLFHALHQLCKLKSYSGAPKRLMTVHDINFAHTRSGKRLQHAERRFLERLQNATHLSFITKFAHDDTLAHFPNSLPNRVIYNGVTSLDINNMQRPEGVPTGPFLFHLSSLVPYKQAELLVQMMDYLPNRTLVLAGRCRNKELLQMAKQRSNVVMIGEVNDSEKAWLYTNCDAFLFPSKAEGFGLPPIEAMLCGKPVFLSNSTSLPEIGGNVAYFWENLLPEQMAEYVNKKMAEPIDTDAIIAHGRQFSWDICADEFITYYKDILTHD